MSIAHPTLFNEIVSQVTEATLATVKETTVLCEESIEDYRNFNKAVMEGTYVSPVDLLESVLANI